MVHGPKSQRAQRFMTGFIDPVAIIANCGLAEHAGPCYWRENLLLQDGEDGGRGNESQVPPGGLKNRGSRELQVNW